jgi:hypothetical protein
MTTGSLASEVEVNEDVVERRRPGAERPADRPLQRALVEKKIRVCGLEPQ